MSCESSAIMPPVDWALHQYRGQFLEEVGVPILVFTVSRVKYDDEQEKNTNIGSETSTIFTSLLERSERVMHLGMFVCLSGRVTQKLLHRLT